MYFNNPDIIKSDTDAVLGCVRMGEGEETINFLGMIRRTMQIYAFYIQQDINALVSDKISHARALSLTALKIYSRLEMFEELPPRDVEHLAELMTYSRNFEKWEYNIQQRFFATHAQKVNEETKIQATSSQGLSQEDIQEIKDEMNLDTILEKLAMYLDIGHPVNS